MRILLYIICVLVAAPLLASEPEIAASEVHIYVEPGEDWPRALVRLPLSALQQDQPDGLNPFVRGNPPRMSIAAYERDFMGFAELLMREIPFASRGEPVAADLGAVTILDTRGASGPFEGLIPNVSLLEICGDPPSDADLSDVQLVVLLLLYADPDAPLELTLPSGLERVAITDHRDGSRRQVAAPAQVSLPAR